MVLTTAINNFQSTINSEGLNKGVYFVKIEDVNKKVVNKKMVLQ